MANPRMKAIVSYPPAIMQNLSRRNITGYLLVGLFFAGALPCLSGCGESTGQSKPEPATSVAVSTDNAATSGIIRIVSSLPRTGSAKLQTDTMVNGIKLALDEAAYKVGDFSLELEDRDDATAATGDWTPDAEGDNARQAANDPDVMVYIGPYNSGAAKVSMPILNRAGLLMISPANTAVGLTKPGLGEPDEPAIYRPTGKKNYARVVPADDLQGTCAAEWAKDMGIKTVYILDDNSFYGKGIAEMFRQRCNELEIDVLGHDSIDTKAQEFRSKMTSIKALKPDLLYYGGTTQTKGGQICKDMVAAGLKCKLMVPDGCMENAFIQAAGPENANERVYVTFGGVPPENQTGRGKEFVERYKKRFGFMPEAYAIYSYEATNAALEAIRKAGKKDRAAIIEAAFAIKDFPGALGNWSFDENGDTTLHKLSGNIVRSGKFEFVRLLGDGNQQKPMGDQKK
ncbi:MAG TPA: branched-chain amino acid ABC transporter substrate-binding protein [Pirellulales bacterium]|jgi:branched-chain amino acid transport system substrate-binding protein|nr:branched-chain amino acid ABC transporter substrate-binding protein [Pirellulales bacterium]